MAKVEWWREIAGVHLASVDACGVSVNLRVHKRGKRWIALVNLTVLRFPEEYRGYADPDNVLDFRTAKDAKIAVEDYARRVVEGWRKALGDK